MPIQKLLGGTADVAASIESEVRSYSRSWPAVFTSARGSTLYSGQDAYVDFFAAAGSLNYGHNDPDARSALIDYLSRDGIIQTLDMQTEARLSFLRALEKYVLRPRGLDGYRVMFTGPTGTNAVEAALKCARLATGRTEVLAFQGGFHGVTLGALAATSNASKRRGGGVPLANVARFPFDNPEVPVDESVEWFERIHFANRSEAELPAGVLVELVQGEGGVNVARPNWVSGIATTCTRYRVPLIVDEIQSGCGRTGPFFAFENYGIKPDIIPVSKSLSGLGLPLSVVLLREDLDLVTPGQHNGTFRGSNASFVTSAVCLSKYWSDDALQLETECKSELVLDALQSSGVAARFPVRGRGLLIGVELPSGSQADKVISSCFEQKLLLESSGRDGQVIKIMPPLTISKSDLAHGLDIVCRAVQSI
ncbi:diaminobutyrate--2-oxoglutarate transaminase [Kocuria marina]|uniref:diaminobutyrate--2-oxoglutarate transaminase n=1 Tax=Kocuria marina TaxID=223184 RepID=UPI0021B5D45E|nr:diaminobutyrate--2-oxoglutarate transaminase [Kocuria indica]